MHAYNPNPAHACIYPLWFNKKTDLQFFEMKVVFVKPMIYVFKVNI